MQITSLNKTINLLIIGTFGLINMYFLDRWFFSSQHVQSLAPDITTVSGQVLWGGVLVPVAIFVGMLIDTVGEIFKVMIRKVTVSKKFYGVFCWLLFIQKDYNNYTYWKSRLEGRFPDIAPEYTTKNGLGTTIFFEQATESSVNWVISHYVSYLMARGFLIIMIIDLPIIINKGETWVYLLLIGIIYLLVSQFLGKIYYAYAFLFRFSDLYVSGYFKQDEVSKDGPVA